MKSMALHARLGVAFVTAMLLSNCGSGAGGGSPGTPPPPASQSYTDPTVYSSAPTGTLQAANEITSTTRASIVVNGARLAYTATAGHLIALSLGTGAPQASFFYVAYTLDGAAPATRPVTFFYNGGPGSASVWLHLGSFGPKRLTAGVPAMTVEPPYPLVDNAETLLDVSDLVFVDAVGSGYSTAIAPNQNRAFWGVDADARVFRDFVMRYVIANNRDSSPRFLFGESYGAPRTAVLANALEQAGLEMKGVVLQSSALNYNVNCGITDAPAVGCGGYLPSYGATAIWYGRATPNPGVAATAEFMGPMRTLAISQYEPALLRFFTVGTLPDAALVAQLAATTGLPASRWQPTFNVGPDFYRANFMPGTVIGRYDSRVSIPDASVSHNDNDPSSSLIATSFVFRITDYLANTLHYTTPSNYVTLSNAIQTWNFSHDGRDLPDTIPDLAAALTHNPRLKVLSMSGYHDLATPFFTTERDLARLAAHANVTERNYLGGHMTYLDDASRVQQKADLAQFYRSALGQ
jgi:carboxypeptidase C (cathepsin A)